MGGASEVGAELSERESRSLLTSHDHGVLSIASRDRSYGLPISYAYDEANDRLIFGFVNTPESKKHQFAVATEEATLTIYEYDDVDSWRSVIVTGPIAPIPDSEVSVQLAPIFFVEEDETGESQLVELDEFDRTWYALQIDEISGRQSGYSIH
ncbi:pyridoxamine 5'-phosphate oxidase family protein [Salinilacihabitans rarus]|uniref:pyridoxamine 5'-phosphate oxidase family protein n=1 Tax=Salinilacihabitans rarus TaxID=2961596 RepID=UPI0020C86543|nr:pyridoxamine 5'-phosphate oxidase family protein [Salinilacihabitans rarus]